MGEAEIRRVVLGEPETPLWPSDDQRFNERLVRQVVARPRYLSSRAVHVAPRSRWELRALAWIPSRAG